MSGTDFRQQHWFVPASCPKSVPDTFYLHEWKRSPSSLSADRSRSRAAAGSKSLTNRALVAAALADGASRLNGALESEDTRVMIDSLVRLGIAVNVDPAENPRFMSSVAAADCRTARSALRRQQRHDDPVSHGDRRVGQGKFGSTAPSACGSGRSRICSKPWRNWASRPEASRPRLPAGHGRYAAVCAGGRAEVRGDVSSQFSQRTVARRPYARGPSKSSRRPTRVAALDAPDAGRDAIVRGERRSRPDRPFSHSGAGSLSRRAYADRARCSAASYFCAAAAITGGRVTVEGLSSAVCKATSLL